MPTRKVSQLERFLLWAREADDSELQQALDIINIERRIRSAGNKPKPGGSTKKPASKKPADVPGPPNPPKPANDQPQG